MPTTDIRERRTSGGKLVRETTKGPHVHLLRVADALSDFWANPVRRAFPCLPVLFLDREGNREAEVSEFDTAVHRRQNIVALDIPVKNVLIVHLEKALRCLVKSVFAKLLAVFSCLINDDFGKWAILHKLKEDPNAIVKLIQVNALDNLVAIKESDKTGFIDD